MHNIARVTSQIDPEKWPKDVDYLAQIYGGLFSIFLL